MNVEVTKKDGDNFVVTITEESGSTEHWVTVTDTRHKELTQNTMSKEELVKKSFEFLLSKESKESILQSFDISAIQQYFPEYIDEVKKWIKK